MKKLFGFIAISLMIMGLVASHSNAEDMFKCLDRTRDFNKCLNEGATLKFYESTPSAFEDTSSELQKLKADVKKLLFEINSELKKRKSNKSNFTDNDTLVINKTCECKGGLYFCDGSGELTDMYFPSYDGSQAHGKIIFKLHLKDMDKCNPHDWDFELPVDIWFKPNYKREP